VLGDLAYSTNGTFVNGTLIGKGNKRRLHDKDCVTLLISNLTSPHFNKESTTTTTAAATAAAMSLAHTDALDLSRVIVNHQP